MRNTIGQALQEPLQEVRVAVRSTQGGSLACLGSMALRFLWPSSQTNQEAIRNNVNHATRLNAMRVLSGLPCLPSSLALAGRIPTLLGLGPSSGPSCATS
jgi:hypothetical protein